MWRSAMCSAHGSEGSAGSIESESIPQTRRGRRAGVVKVEAASQSCDHEARALGVAVAVAVEVEVACSGPYREHSRKNNERRQSSLRQKQLSILSSNLQRATCLHLPSHRTAPHRTAATARGSGISDTRVHRTRSCMYVTSFSSTEWGCGAPSPQRQSRRTRPPLSSAGAAHHCAWLCQPCGLLLLLDVFARVFAPLVQQICRPPGP